MPSLPPDEPAEQDGAGAPDGFQRLWMPHRMAYIKGDAGSGGRTKVLPQLAGTRKLTAEASPDD